MLDVSLLNSQFDFVLLFLFVCIAAIAKLFYVHLLFTLFAALSAGLKCNLCVSFNPYDAVFCPLGKRILGSVRHSKDATRTWRGVWIRLGWIISVGTGGVIKCGVSCTGRSERGSLMTGVKSDRRLRYYLIDGKSRFRQNHVCSLFPYGIVSARKVDR